MTIFIDLLVDGCIFLNVGVRVRQVRLRLIVIVVRHEVGHRIVRKEHLELRTELRRQGLVVSQHERRTLLLLDDIGHREGLSRSRGSEQRLMLLAFLEPLNQMFNSRGLITGWLEGGNEAEWLGCGHGCKTGLE